MANTYTQIFIQMVFAVEERQNLISKTHKEELYKYITGTLKNRKQKVLAINGMPDHIHILFSMTPEIALSDLVQEVKAASSALINQKGWVRGHFNWQRGFGAFSYSRSQISAVARYIENQEKHHAKRSFRDEYTELLRKFEVEYDERYLFKFLDQPR